MTTQTKDSNYSDWKKGDRIQFHGREGTLLAISNYQPTPSIGWSSAKVKWDDGEESTFMLNGIGCVRMVKK